MRRPTADWTRAEVKALERRSSPEKIQAYLDSIPYDPDYRARSPRWVMRERKATCFEGALFAAAALRRLGHRPLLVDMRAWNDDDHVIAVIRRGRFWGAVAKSNVTVLRYREPVYRSLRELVMSYFDLYVNTIGQKTLRSYSRPLDLSRFDARRWMTTDEDLDHIGDALDAMHHIPLLTPAMIQSLSRADKALLETLFMGSNPEGLYQAREGLRERFAGRSPDRP